MDVGAGDIDLQPAHLLLGVQLLADLGVFRHRKAADIGHHRLVKYLLELRQFRFDHRVHAGILQTHSVQQTAGVLRDAGRGIPEAGLPGRALEGKGAQHIDVVQLRKLIAKAEGAAGGDNGVVHLNTAEGHFCIHHTISSFSSTGPSLQIRLLPYFVLQEQPMQAPKPQPIRSSKLNWPEVLQALYTAFSIGSGPQV